VSEHPKVNKARLAVSKVSDLESELFSLKAHLETAKVNAAIALREMEASGEPDEPWAAHWRDNLECFAKTPKATPAKKGKRR
jgi:hypothetical protein